MSRVDGVSMDNEMGDEGDVVSFGQGYWLMVVVAKFCVVKFV